MPELLADFLTLRFALAIGIALMGGSIYGFAGFGARPQHGTVAGVGL